MTTHVLWLDNDVAWTVPYVKALQAEGFEVTVVATLSDAESVVQSSRLDMLILDIMIPTRSEDEELQYPPERTRLGHESGLLFYTKWRPKFVEERTPVLVLTVRSDQVLIAALKAAGLPQGHFTTKLALREVDTFLAKVVELCSGKGSQQGGMDA